MRYLRAAARAAVLIRDYTTACTLATQEGEDLAVEVGLLLPHRVVARAAE